MNTLLLKLLGGLLALGITLGYISVLRSDNKALEASVDRYKLMSEHNASVANDNAKLLIEHDRDYSLLFDQYVKLQQDVLSKEREQQIKEIEVVKYVNTLPEGFEKQCLNMPVPTNIGRMQNH